MGYPVKDDKRCPWRSSWFSTGCIKTTSQSTRIGFRCGIKGLLLQLCWYHSLNEAASLWPTGCYPQTAWCFPDEVGAESACFCSGNAQFWWVSIMLTATETLTHMFFFRINPHQSDLLMLLLDRLKPQLNSTVNQPLLKHCSTLPSYLSARQEIDQTLVRHVPGTPARANGWESSKKCKPAGCETHGYNFGSLQVDVVNYHPMTPMANIYLVLDGMQDCTGFCSMPYNRGICDVQSSGVWWLSHPGRVDHEMFMVHIPIKSGCYLWQIDWVNGCATRKSQ